MLWLLYAWISRRLRLIVILNFYFFIIHNISLISLINFFIWVNFILLIPEILIVLLSLKKFFLPVFLYLLSLNEILFFYFILNSHKLFITYRNIWLKLRKCIVIVNKNIFWFTLGVFSCLWELRYLLWFPYMILLRLHAGIASSFSLLSKVYLRALPYYFRL